MRAVALGGPLAVEDVVGVARAGWRLALPPAAEAQVARGRAYVDRLEAGDDLVYGITTGVGKLKDVRIAREDRQALQLNLLRSHAAGLGPTMGAADTRAMWCCLAASLARGHSGVRPAVVQLLVECLNRGVTPVVPEWGSLGASGDLIPLAHAGLVLIGEGEATLDGRPLPGRAALEAAGLAPVVLEAKEGLALLNGTHQMAGVGTLLLADAAATARLADVTACLSLEALMGTNTAADPRIHALRPHPGQAASAANVRRAHRRERDHRLPRRLPPGPGRLQPPLRPPGARGDSRGVRVRARGPDPRAGERDRQPARLRRRRARAHAAGTFTASRSRSRFDTLALGLGYLAGIAERRIDRLVNPLVSELPAFLAADAGLQSGYMLAQVQAAALASEIKALAHPASADSIPTSGNQEDFVPMGAAAARKCREVLRRVQAVLAIEAVCAAQALDCRAPLRPGTGSAAAHAALRSRVPPLTADRVIREDITAALALVEDGSLLAAVEAAVGPLD